MRKDTSHITSLQLTGVEIRQEQDPRIKSPDDILTRLSPKKPAAPAFEKHDDRTAELTRELADVRAHHQEEILEWKEYESRIQDWRTQVVAVVDGLRSENILLQKEIDALKKAQAPLKVLE